MPRRLGLGSLTVALNLLQPLARLVGRLPGGLSPWRRHCKAVLTIPLPRQKLVWSARWTSLDGWLTGVEAGLRAGCPSVARGSDYDRWDLEVRGGAFGVMRLLCAIEEHGGGKQLARFRCWPRFSRGAVALGALFGVLSVVAALDGAWLVGLLLGVVATAVAALAIYDCGVAGGTLAQALEGPLPARAGTAASKVIPPAATPEPQVGQGGFGDRGAEEQLTAGNGSATEQHGMAAAGRSRDAR